MANNCDTIYKITGSQKAVNNLWNRLQSMNVNIKDIWLDNLAKSYGIDYAKRNISVRGHIYYADFEVDEINERYVLTVETDTAWSGCHNLFFAINETLQGEMNISYREIECGCEIFTVHDEENFFPEECCVNSSGNPFEDVCSDIYDTVKDAINEWCEKTGISQGTRSDKQMVEYINDYEYEDVDTYFYINTFTFI